MVVAGKPCTGNGEHQQLKLKVKQSIDWMDTLYLCDKPKSEQQSGGVEWHAA